MEKHLFATLSSSSSIKKNKADYR